MFQCNRKSKISHYVINKFRLCRNEFQGKDFYVAKRIKVAIRINMTYSCQVYYGIMRRKGVLLCQKLQDAI